MTVGIVVAAIGVAFLAAACQSLTAFGFALVMVPLLSLAWEVKPAVVTSTVLGTLLILPLFYEVRGRVQVRGIVPMLLGSLAGIPLGLLLLDRIQPGALELLVASLVIVASLALYFSPRLRLERPWLPLSVFVGGLSGALRAATSMGGPPVVLYTLSLEREIESFRATLLALFLPTSLVTVAGLAIAGFIDGDVLLVSAAALPAVALGAFVGARVRARVSQRLFRAVVLAILLASSGAVLAAAALG